MQGVAIGAHLRLGQARQALGVRPVYKRVDTCAAEFEARTPYMYSTYEAGGFGQAPEDESRPTDRRKAIILGGGPNRIGQGIEFDYCCCHAAFAMAELRIESIMVNCNPETVSTDYDTSDRLYFESLTAEDVLELIAVEQSRGELLGVIVQFGGQTPLGLAAALQAAGVPILGTSPDAIDLAEDRERFQRLLQDLGLRQPENATARSWPQAREKAAELGYPFVMRPSYVLGGRGMEIIRDAEALDRYILHTGEISPEHPILLDHYLSRATEVDVDAVCDGTDVFGAGVMEHIEEAGVHSGDSACSLPPFSLRSETVEELRRQTDAMARALGVRGLMNVQFAIEEPLGPSPRIYVLEVNPRASRTVPFVAKAIGVPVAKIAARVMAGEMLADLPSLAHDIGHIAIKEAVFPWGRFPGVDPVLSPEMKSTGEVMGIDDNFEAAFYKSQLGGGVVLPTGGTVFVSVKEGDKAHILPGVRLLADIGFTIVATSGTADYLGGQGIVVQRVNKVAQGRPHIVDRIKDGGIDLIFNTTEGWQSLKDSREIRVSAVTQKIPYFTTAAASVAASRAIAALRDRPLEVRPLQSYYPSLPL